MVATNATGKMGMRAFDVLGAAEGVAPEAREEDVRGQREERAGEPDAARRGARGG